MGWSGRGQKGSALANLYKMSDESARERVTKQVRVWGEQVQVLLCSTIDWELIPDADHPRLLRELADLEHLRNGLDERGHC